MQENQTFLPVDLFIIGAGPGGLSMAVEAIESGISHDKIKVVEKNAEHSWSIRKFYPENKLVTANYKGKAADCEGRLCLIDSSKQETLSFLDDTIIRYQLNVGYDEEVYKIEKDKSGQLFFISTTKGFYQAKICVVAIGILGKPNKPSYEIPSTLRDKVFFDITSAPIQHKKILVVGGGDTASEYVQYLLQENNQLTLSYRQKEFSRMNQLNLSILLQLERENKVILKLDSSINKLEDLEGKIKVNYINHADEIYDGVVYALGGTSPTNFLKLIGIEFNGQDPILINEYETSVPGLFLVGDLSAGKKGGSIISAFNSSHRAMAQICRDYLNCKI
jgi:thioredoxin reductase (NADPH)